MEKNGKRSHPLLAVAWGSHIHIIELKEQRNSLKFYTKLRFRLDTEVVACEWLDNRVLVLLTIKDDLKIFDPFSLSQLDSVNVKFMELVYHNRFSRQSATGGATIYNYSSSMCQYEKGVYILGLKSLHYSYLLTWEERISVFISKDNWLQALELCKEYYTDTVPVVIGLPKDGKARKMLISDKIVDTLQAYMRTAVLRNSVGDSEPINQVFSYQVVGCAAIEYLVLVDRTDVLYGGIYEQFADIKKENFFLELIEPYILSDQLRYLHPEIMHTFVEYYSSQKKLKQVEKCIVHLDIASLDFHQVATLCRQHQLFNALIYIYTVGLADFVTPLQHILQSLIQYVKNENTRLELGATVQLTLEYITKCMQNKYPDGTKKPQSGPSIRDQVLKFLFDKDTDSNSGNYQRISTLLMLDSKGFLNALSPCVEDPRFQGEFVTKQYIIDALVHLTEFRSDLFKQPQIEDLYLFLASQYAKGNGNISPTLLEKIVSYCTSPQYPGNFDERQKTLLSLVFRSNSSVDRNRLLIMTEGAGFYKVAEFLHRQNKNYAKALNCHLKDEDLKKNVFDFIRNLMENSDLNQKEKGDVKNATIANLRHLVAINSSQASRLIIQLFSQEHIEY